MTQFNRALALIAACTVFASISGCVTATDDQPTAQSVSSEETSAPLDNKTTSPDGDIDEKQVADGQGGVAPRDPNEIICKRIRATGSKFNKRACHTRAEWEALAREGRDLTDEIKQRSLDSATR